MRRTVEAMLVVAIVLDAALFWLLTLVFSVTVLTWSRQHRGELLSGPDGVTT